MYLRDKLTYIMKENKEVILLRAESEEYASLFVAAGYEPVFIEPLKFTFTNESRLKEILVNTAYDGLILSSPRTVEAVARQWDARTPPTCARAVYTVGPASARDAVSLLGTPTRGAGAGDSRTLADYIIRENSKGKRFLFPCSSLTDETLVDILRSAGLVVDLLPVYETTEHPELLNNLKVAGRSRPMPVALVFFSPSGCHFVHSHLQWVIPALADIPQFAIGQTTARALMARGIRAAGIASAPCPSALVATLNDYFHHLELSLSTSNLTSDP